MSGGDKGNEEKWSRGEREKGGCVCCSLTGEYLSRELRKWRSKLDSGRRESQTERPASEKALRWGCARPLWGTSGQWGWSRAIRGWTLWGKIGEKIETPVRTSNTGTMDTEMHSWPLNHAGVRGANTPLPAAARTWKSSCCYLCLKNKGIDKWFTQRREAETVWTSSGLKL